MSRLAPLTFERVRTAFAWDESSQRYRLRSSGRFVTRQAVKRALLDLVDGAKAELQRLAARMAVGAIPIGTWQRETARLLKSLHLASWAAARGGFDALTPSDYGRVGGTLQFVYRRLSSFAWAVEQGALSGPQIEARSAMYSSHAHTTFEGGRRYGAETAGFLYERNVMGPAEHCAQCIEESAKGWVGIGGLTLPGTRLCRVNCRCSLVYAREVAR